MRVWYLVLFVDILGCFFLNSDRITRNKFYAFDKWFGRNNLQKYCMVGFAKKYLAINFTQSACGTSNLTWKPGNAFFYFYMSGGKCLYQCGKCRWYAYEGFDKLNVLITPVIFGRNPNSNLTCETRIRILFISSNSGHFVQRIGIFRWYV